MIPIHRLTRAKDVKVLMRFGRRRESRFFRITALPNDALFSRFAFITPKLIDKRAVLRNRLRRRAREWIRTHVNSPMRPLDMAIYIKKDAKTATQKEFYQDFEGLIGYFFSH